MEKHSQKQKHTTKADTGYKQENPDVIRMTQKTNLETNVKQYMSGIKQNIHPEYTYDPILAENNPNVFGVRKYTGYMHETTYNIQWDELYLVWINKDTHALNHVQVARAELRKELHFKQLIDAGLKISVTYETRAYGTKVLSTETKTYDKEQYKI